MDLFSRHTIMFAALALVLSQTGASFAASLSERESEPSKQAAQTGSERIISEPTKNLREPTTTSSTAEKMSL